MIVGEYVLTEYDLKDCVRFDDAIAAGNYDIDIHSPDGSGTSHYYFPAGKWYTIPYRSLLPKGAANLIVAGRCISATHAAQASIPHNAHRYHAGRGGGRSGGHRGQGGCGRKARRRTGDTRTA